MLPSPPATDTEPATAMTTVARSAGALALTLNASNTTPVRVDLHTCANVQALLAAYGSVRLTSLDVLVTPTALGVDRGYVVHLGWGHVEHSYPTKLSELVQLPAYTSVVVSPSGAITPSAFACPLVAPVNPSLKPVLPEGGRPALFAFIEGVEDAVGDLANLVFRFTVECSGHDVVIV